MSHTAFCTVRDTDKAAALLWLLREGLPKKSPTLVFASTRHHVEFLTLLLTLEGVEVTAVHGSMDQVREQHKTQGACSGSVHLAAVYGAAIFERCCAYLAK